MKMHRLLVLAAPLLFVSQVGRADPPADPSINDIYQYMVPSICATDVTEKGTTDDPYACPTGTHRRSLRFGEEIPYVRLKNTFNFPAGATQPSPVPANSATTVMTMFPVKDGKRHEFAAIITDGKSEANHAGLLDFEMTDDYGINSWDLTGQQYFSSVETNSSSEGPYGWFGIGCVPKDSWSMFPLTYQPFISPNGQINVQGVHHTTYALGMTPPTANGMQDFFLVPPLKRLESNGGLSYSLWRNGAGVASCGTSDFPDMSTRPAPPIVKYYSQDFTFEPNDNSATGKTMKTAVREYYYSDPEFNYDPSDSSGGTVPRVGMELSRYTREYGHTRWETWKSALVIYKDCLANEDVAGDPVKAQTCTDDAIEKATTINAAKGYDKNDCPNSSGSRTITTSNNSVTAYRVSCSDRSLVLPINSTNVYTKIPIQPRVWHFSREVLGANQNWIALPDFAGLPEQIDMDATAAFNGRWKKSGNVGTWNLKMADTKTRNMRLGFTCNANTACSVYSKRTITGASPGSIDISPIMTSDERADLSWLVKLRVGVSVYTSSAFPTAPVPDDGSASIKLEIFVDGASIGSETFPVGPNAKQRISFTPAFKFSDANAVNDLLRANDIQLTITSPKNAGEVTVDDIYMLPSS